MKIFKILTVVVSCCSLIALAFYEGRRTEHRNLMSDKLQHFQMLGDVYRYSQSNIVTQLQDPATRDLAIHNLAVFYQSSEATTADVRLITIALAKAVSTEKAEWPSNYVAQVRLELENFNEGRQQSVPAYGAQSAPSAEP